MEDAATLLRVIAVDEAVTFDKRGITTRARPVGRFMRRANKGPAKGGVVTAQRALPGRLTAVHAPAIQGVRVGPAYAKGGREALPISGRLHPP